jgi:hypothetical protein
MASYVAAGVPAQIIRVSYTTLFRVAAEYLGDAMYWTRIALMNGLTDPWITSLIELKIPVSNADWPTDGILGAWSQASNVVVAPTVSALPSAPVAPAITLADLQALLPYLPTELPDAPGIMWNDGGVIAIS